MPQIVTCPDCDKKLRVPDDLLGKKVRCPGCTGMFKATADGDTQPVPAAAKSEARRGAAPARSEARRQPAPDRDDRISSPTASGRRPGPRDGYEDEDEDEEDRRPSRRRDEEDDRDRPRSRRRDEEEEDEDHPRRRYEEDDDRDDRKPRNVREGWKKVKMGLGLVATAGWVKLGYYGAGILGGGLIMLVGVGAMSAAASSSNPNAGARTAVGGIMGVGIGMLLLLIVLGLVGLAETVLRLVGLGFCLMVPNKRKSPLRGLAIAAFACAAGVVVLSWGGALLNGVSSGLRGGGTFGAAMALSGGSSGLGLLAYAVLLGAFLTFCFFLRSVALALRNEELAHTVVKLMIGYGIAVAVTFVLGILMVIIGFAAGYAAVNSNSAQGAATSFGVLGIFSVAFGCILFLGYLGLYIWYLLTIAQVRAAVDRYLRRTA